MTEAKEQNPQDSAPKNERKEDENGSKAEDENVVVSSQPSMSLALFIFWVVPVLIIAIFSRFGVDIETPVIPIEPSRPVQISYNKRDARRTERIAPSATPKRATRGPTAYQETMNEIYRRNRRWLPVAKIPPKASTVDETVLSESSSRTEKTSASTPRQAQSSSPSSRRGAQQMDPLRTQLANRIEQYRMEYQSDPDDVWKAINLADALRMMDLKYHDGGSRQSEALEVYQHAIDITLAKRQRMIEDGQPTDLSLSGTRNIPAEILFSDNSQKSVDGLLCSLYSSLGKMYFMANMFEKAVESYSKCIEIEPLYLDAVGSRGSALIILGKYAEAGSDFTTVIEHDKERLFNDAFTGLAKVLAAKEEVVPQGWGPMVEIIENLLPNLEKNAEAAHDKQAKQMIAEALNRLYHVMFVYHDVKTQDADKAWHYLSTGYKHKMSVLPPFNEALEKQKVATTKQVFKKGFWPEGVGSDTNVPIFIIGFVRSGSTLLERVLDAHPAIVGTGEDSVFNGRLDEIRNAIVQASMTGNSFDLITTVQEKADSVVEEMRARYEVIEANTGRRRELGQVEPQRFADKMLTNYFNVGFIHMLFPNALILHVARNPMDTVFSAYKHEFPPGALDYTSGFSSLAQMYESYRSVIDHWDDVLPGRITHVRYEDLVADMPGMARAIINSTGLPWDDSVLDFHKKKHAVNTLSTTQVRRGIYKDSLEAWKKYENYLQPLEELVGDSVKWDLKTSLNTYVPPAEEEITSTS